MGAVGSIDKCYKDVCCPKEFKLLEDNQREDSSLKKDLEKKNNSNLSIDYKDNLNQQKQQIFLFDHDEYNYFDNDEKIEAHIYENNNLENIQFYENNFKNEIDLINDDNNIFESSQKSGPNSSNFSFKCFDKNSKKDNYANIKAKFIKLNEKNNNIADKNNRNNINNNKKNDLNPKISKEYMSKILKIQRFYRIYINKKRISEKKTGLEEDIYKENEKEDYKENYRDNAKNKIKKLKDLSLTKIKNSKNYSCLLLNRYLIDIDFIDVSEESFRSVTMKSNKLLEFEPPQFCTLRELDNDQIKGYFLLKKKMFKYQGQKDNEGKKFGFGRIFWEDSSKLKGYFKDSKLNGIVYFYNCGNDSSTFFGEYKNNIPHGYGIYNRKGYTLEGSCWTKNILNDVGVAIWEEGEIYEGEFKNSVKEGIGLYRWADGTSYIGEFKKNKVSGFGKISFSNGNTYEGEFNEGFLSGWGKFVWDDGKYYIGNYLKDKKHGFGIFVWSLEPLIALIGFWNQGKQNGVNVKLFKGHCKIVFASESKSIIEIHSRYEISKYLLPSQSKYKNFFKKKYHEFAKFINFASK